MRVRSVLAGALALIVLELVVSNNQASGRVAGFFGGLAAAANWFLDPTIPGIPDRSGSSPTLSGAVASSATHTTATTGATSTPPSSNAQTIVAPTGPALTDQQSQEVFAATGGYT